MLRDTGTVELRTCSKAETYIEHARGQAMALRNWLALSLRGQPRREVIVNMILLESSAIFGHATVRRIAYGHRPPGLVLASGKCLAH
jgi:hypothetical protein